ncbi:MAG: DAK2 domain-containing protein [Chloroflexota bacterium]|nr:DAK2 domain-containing protein [Chloroflexota bacterium]
MLAQTTVTNRVIDGHLAKRLIGSGLAWLESNKERVNQLNVFPVPDGDTGTNMWLTMRSAYAAISDLDEPHIGNLSQALARGALMGARGNSGVILSQIWSGVAMALDGHAAMDARLLASAAQSAVDMAYKAVETPVEGTILTVCKDMMMSVVERYPRQPDLIALLKRMVFAGRAGVRRTPDLLPVLKKAGVVDSGGQGLVFIFEGMLRALCGRSVEVNLDLPIEETRWQDAIVPEDDLGYGYDVQFLMRGNGMSIDAVRRDIAAMGWSTLVVGDNQLIKVHVHVHNPGEPISYAIGTGAALDDVVVENMQHQYEQYLQERTERKTETRHVAQDIAVITVANGKGLHRLFADDLGAAYVISGGQTMNPSTGDFLKAIDALENSEIIILPNNKNILLAAQQAAQIVGGRRVRVVASRTIPQGIAAMVEYSSVMSCEVPPPTLERVLGGMTAGLEYVVSAEITNANRDAEIDGLHVKAGQWIGLVDDVLVVNGNDIDDLALRLLERADARSHERVAVYYGADVTEAQARALVDKLAAQFADQAFELVCGDQALYPYIMSIE